MAKIRYTHEAAEKINDVLFSDSRISIDAVQLLVALEHDMGARGSTPPTGELPTTEEIELLVLGDEDGNIPEELIKRFPQTHELIKDQF